MGIEIERKFLLSSNEWRKEVIQPGIPMIQGYLCSVGATVRVRLAGNNAFLTIKGAPKNLRRSEFEYPIPVADAQAMLSELAIGSVVEKVRYVIPEQSGLYWEIDEYFGSNAPLFTAEIELPSPEYEFIRPAWLGQEISRNGRYTNRSLSRFPYSTWAAEENKE